MKKFLLIFVIVNFFLHSAFSQSRIIDSLKTELQNAKQDSSRIQLYHALCQYCPLEENLMYAWQIIKLADKMLSETSDKEKRKSILEQKATGYFYMSVFYSRADMPDRNKAMEMDEKMLKVSEDEHDTANVVETLRQLSGYFLSLGNFQLAIKYIQQGITVSEKMNYKKEPARIAFLSV